MKNKSFYIGEIEITAREIIASVFIVAVMLIFGLLISNHISEAELDQNQIYNTAVKIDKPDLFKYGMQTNIGNAFVYGDLKAVDTVTYPELDQKTKYMYVKKVEEHYTMHTRQVAHTGGSGKYTYTYYTTETYWTWDFAGQTDMTCKKISFCGATLDSSKIRLPGESYITTKYESLSVRYQYYGTGTQFKGTIFASLKNNTIANGTKFYQDQSIADTVKSLESNFPMVIFWVLWILLTGGMVVGFYYLKNNWLN